MPDQPSAWTLESNYAALPEALYERVGAERFPAPRVLVVNAPLAKELGLDPDALSSPEGARLLAGEAPIAGSRPVAQAYAGHQYGHFTMLGDGRAVLLGERRLSSGALVDVALKGSGRTRFSRRGDGRAALGPMLREYIVGEAMHALGIPTSRALAVLATGEAVMRDGPKQGAILVRVAASHIRVGTFQFAAALGDEAALRALADHAIARHDPDLVDAPARHAAFLRRVVGRQAHLVAQWQCVGFVHGVMNTDNMAVSGETIDFGPCAFLDAYDPDAVFSSIDRHGRYAYAQQPRIAQWNLARFAEAMVPLLDDDEATAIARANWALGAFPALYRRAWVSGMRAKLGISRLDAAKATSDAAEPDAEAEGKGKDMQEDEREEKRENEREGEHECQDGCQDGCQDECQDEDETLAHSLLDAMHAARADFTRTFRALAERAELPDAPAFAAWRARWVARLARDGMTPESARASMLAANPAVIPRNHRVEEALAAAEGPDGLAPLQALVSAVSRPFDPPPALAHLRDGPPDSWCGYRTFCGT
ncbi:MAG: protein adenylyltransferase SelO [Planctomycetota bacterium]